MKNMTRAELRKWRRKFRVGDLVTWGRGVYAHPVVEIVHNGVRVDARSAGFSKRLLIVFDGNARASDGAVASRGTLRLVQRQDTEKK